VRKRREDKVGPEGSLTGAPAGSAYLRGADGGVAVLAASGDQGVYGPGHGVVSGIVGRAGGVEPAVLIDALKLDVMAGMAGELAQIEKLGAAVAVAEGVKVIDIADDFRGAPREGLRGTVLEEALRGEAAMDVRNAHDKTVRGHEVRAALGERDLADLSGPGIDVLKKMVVQGLEMVEIETAGRRRLREPDGGM